MSNKATTTKSPLKCPFVKIDKRLCAVAKKNMPNDQESLELWAWKKSSNWRWPNSQIKVEKNEEQGMSFYNCATINVDYNWIVQLKPHPGWHRYWNYFHLQTAWSCLGPDEYFNLVEDSDNVHRDYRQRISVFIWSCFLHYGNLDGNSISVWPYSNPNHASNLQYKLIWTFRNGNSCWTHHIFLHLSRYLHRGVVIRCFKFQTSFRRIPTITRKSPKFPISDSAINWTVQNDQFCLAENSIGK